MTILHLKSVAGPDGKVYIGPMDVGRPGAEVDITLSVKDQISDEQWRREMRDLLDSMGNIHVEAYPRHPVRDPWSQA